MSQLLVHNIVDSSSSLEPPYPSPTGLLLCLIYYLNYSMYILCSGSFEGVGFNGYIHLIPLSPAG
jgi:hypothetical protein